MRQLLLMVDGKSYQDWKHTCEIVAMTRNANATRRSDLIDPRRIHPHGRGALSGSATPINDLIKKLSAKYRKPKE